MLGEIKYMKIGQMSFPRLSNNADYLQLDVAGLTVEEAINKYKNYNTDLPIILHGDWEKRSKNIPKGTSENNLDIRYKDYIDMINKLKDLTNVLGITIHPTKRNKMSLEENLKYIKEISLKTNIDVFIENRSSKLLNLSLPEEIIECSQNNLMTIDIPQLYISCGYNYELLIDILKKLNMDNIKEFHLANIKRNGSHTFVGRKLNDLDCELNISEIMRKIPITDNTFITLEILGGINVFDNMKSFLKKLI